MTTPIEVRYCPEHGTQPTRDPDGSYIYNVDPMLFGLLPKGHLERLRTLADAAALAMGPGYLVEELALGFRVFK